ncbi:MAG: hypothetical protein ACLRWH_04525 [Emergencia sp.]
MGNTSLIDTNNIEFAPKLLKNLLLEQNSIPNEEDLAVRGGNRWVESRGLEKAFQRLHAAIYRGRALKLHITE